MQGVALPPQSPQRNKLNQAAKWFINFSIRFSSTKKKKKKERQKRQKNGGARGRREMNIYFCEETSLSLSDFSCYFDLCNMNVSLPLFHIHLKSKRVAFTQADDNVSLLCLGEHCPLVYFLHSWRKQCFAGTCFALYVSLKFLLQRQLQKKRRSKNSATVIFVCITIRVECVYFLFIYLLMHEKSIPNPWPCSFRLYTSKILFFVNMSNY